MLLKIAVASGEVPVGKTIAVIGEEGEELAIEAPDRGDERSAEKPAEAPRRDPDREEGRKAAADVASTEPAVSGSVPSQGSHRDESATSRDPQARLKASPLARRIARERGIELSDLTGTGPDGRIVAEDVEDAEAPPAPVVEAPTGQVESVPLTSVRKTIARRLTAAWQVPVFELTVSADMTRADALLERARELNPDVRLTVTDLLAKVCAQALVRHPRLNVQFTAEALLRLPSANIGIAVAAPQGLVVPVVRGVERLSLAEFAGRRAEVIARALENRLKQDDLEGGTFTISNLGMFGVEQFVAILNPPQAAILAVGATEPRPVARGGEVVVRPMLTATLTVDHRAVDGAPAAEFLRTVKSYLEEPGLAL
jgi:pyruvate dehydrogenase E2 component (dihydrolipoamide acetyltransferase)